MRKDTCEAAKRMPISFLKKHRYLDKPNSLIGGNINWNWNGNPTGGVTIAVCTYIHDMHVRVTCTHTNRRTDEKTDLDYKIRLVTTKPFFGGIRYWFICPLSVNGKPCNRRVGVLYLEGKYFGCRHCYDLAYYSQYDKTPACIGVIGDIWRLEGQINEVRAKMRVKYWKGKPTKRYLRLMAKTRRLRSMYPLINGANDELEKRLAK